jgi:hypothetical protein
MGSLFSLSATAVGTMSQWLATGDCDDMVITERWRAREVEESSFFGPDNFPRENSENPRKPFGQDAQETLKTRISRTGGRKENHISQICRLLNTVT